MFRKWISVELPLAPLKTDFWKAPNLNGRCIYEFNSYGNSRITKRKIMNVLLKYEIVKKNTHFR